MSKGGCHMLCHLPLFASVAVLWLCSSKTASTWILHSRHGSETFTKHRTSAVLPSKVMLSLDLLSKHFPSSRWVNGPCGEKEPHGVRRADCAGNGSAGNGLMRHQHTQMQVLNPTPKHLFGVFLSSLETRELKLLKTWNFYYKKSQSPVGC